MRKMAMLAVVLVAMVSLAACAGETTYVIPYEELALGERAQTVLDEHMTALVEEFQADQDATEDGIDITGAEPVFVGYELVAFEEEPDDVGNTEYVSLYYLNGMVTTSPDAPEPLTDPPSVNTLHIDDMRTGPEDPDDDERAAMLAAADTLEEQFSPEDLEGVVLGIRNYMFLYEDGEGSAVLLGKSADGEMSTWTSVIALEEAE
jgi:hypothetical protein